MKAITFRNLCRDWFDSYSRIFEQKGFSTALFPHTEPPCLAETPHLLLQLHA